MTGPHDIRHDLEAGVSDDVIRLAERLQRERPVPAPRFRGDLRRRLLSGPSPHLRPQRLRVLIAGYAGGGTALLLIGAASVLGVGPLGA